MRLIIRNSSSRLKQLRREWAEQSKLPPFVIFHDETLKSISRSLPVTLADFSQVKGVGKQKLEAYGVAVTSLVKQFLERRPESRPFASDRAQGRSFREPKSDSNHRGDLQIVAAGEDTRRDCPRSGTGSLHRPQSPGSFDFERQAGGFIAHCSGRKSSPHHRKR